MMKIRWLVAVAFVAFLGWGFAGDEPGGKDLKLFQGTWQVESYAVNGKECPKELVSKAKITFSGDKFTEKPDMVFQKGKFRLGDGYTIPVRLDDSKQPKWIDFIVEIDGKKAANQGIYELKGDELKICYRGGPREDGSEPNRPPQFVSKADSGAYLLVLKRDKK